MNDKFSLYQHLKSLKQSTNDSDELIRSLEGAGVILPSISYSNEQQNSIQISRMEDRRNKLGECLIHSVFEVLCNGDEDQNCHDCYTINEVLEEQICSFLGHPRTCPHGTTIPPGKCCHQLEDDSPRLLCRLSNLKPKQEAVITFLGTLNNQKLNKYAGMGIFPGKRIKLLRKSPSIVFKVGHSKYASDLEMANNIYVIPIMEAGDGQ